ncbi:MAG TPA: bacillithiol biosynthesis deacetylase BshB1 [Bryobacteraceae bacterium]
MPVDVLLFGAHPDDVEWGAGGVMLLLKEKGLQFAMVDLTEGEMGSRGTTKERRQEAVAAADFVGASARENLRMPDCGLVDTPESRKLIASVIRRYRPQFVLAPFWKDRHPDHAATGLMVRNSALFCALAKLDDGHAPHKPAAFLYFLLHNYRHPSIVVDVTRVYEKKLQLLRLHHSQFSKTADQLGLLPLGNSDYLYGLESRDRYFGSLIGVPHGEALVADRPLKLSNVEQIFST